MKVQFFRREKKDWKNIINEPFNQSIKHALKAADEPIELRERCAAIPAKAGSPSPSPTFWRRTKDRVKPRSPLHRRGRRGILNEWRNVAPQLVFSELGHALKININMPGYLAF